jgi:hypothetical protein
VRPGGFADGRAFPSQVGGSVLLAIGLAELATRTGEEYAVMHEHFTPGLPPESFTVS